MIIALLTLIILLLFYFSKVIEHLISIFCYKLYEFNIKREAKSDKLIEKINKLFKINNKDLY
jgi:hypothetical protein